MFTTLFAIFFLVSLFLALVGGLFFHMRLFPKPTYRTLTRPIADATQTSRLHAAIFQ